MYLEPWHADVYEFLDLRKNHGKVCLFYVFILYGECSIVLSCFLVLQNTYFLYNHKLCCNDTEALYEYCNWEHPSN